MVADRAGELARKKLLAAAIERLHDGAAVGYAQRGFERFGQPLARPGRHLDPVDHHVDRMLLVARQLRRLAAVELDDARLAALGAQPHAHEALRLQIGEQLHMLALAVGQHRRQQHQPRALGQRQHAVDHLRDGLRFQRVFRVIWAIGRAGARVQQPQIVVDLGDRAHRRARIVAGCLLLDRDRRRQALDQVDVGLFHQLQELPRIGRQRFHVVALPLGI